MTNRWKIGDVFLFPIDDERVGMGQIIDVLPSELYVVIFESAWDVNSPPQSHAVVGRTPLFGSLTLDARLHHGDWKIIGNVTGNLADIALPLSKVRISGQMHVESHDGKWSRLATDEEGEQLRFRKTVAPIRLEKALQAEFGLIDKSEAYDELRYNLVVDSARIGNRPGWRG
ncbi:immunity 26/phosphotriesterase HocA family protein [Blastopirellula sp. JC732]|uniref:Immunity 26/phosphotriesterase HocA family protein n=1 Tax=Blastopirellula sediminis TaxID=2894196 RepID=A0A9X1MKZ5_9BACT|nr:Imm26 family immunity protein [Blastopirellula sediminis]MCC9608315.1 immunity 26/phosphotriesterase HocA family protein [Blastopirellula sediminis]MCC9628908.1 immunity 26/phosphotriesterase HocA family protein [Blastopirellula sediminis]